MDAKKAKIRELNEQVKESGERVRQIQKGAVFMSLRGMPKLYFGLTNGNLQHSNQRAELQGLGTFLTLEELTEKDESLLQQVQQLVRQAYTQLAILTAAGSSHRACCHG